MKLEDQVCGLEYGKQLKELGIKQESLFYWVGIETKSGNLGFGLTYFQLIFQEKDKFKEIYSAFTVAELFDLLPAWIDTKNNEPFNFFWFTLVKRNAKNIQYIANYICDSIPGHEINNPLFGIELPNCKKHDENLANCLASILIHLIENKLINV